VSEHILDKPQSDSARRARAMRGRLGFDADDDDNDVGYYARVTVTLPTMTFGSDAEFRIFARCWRVGKRRGLESIPGPRAVICTRVV
jgi:hypothetical protein